MKAYIIRLIYRFFYKEKIIDNNYHYEFKRIYAFTIEQALEMARILVKAEELAQKEILPSYFKWELIDVWICIP